MRDTILPNLAVIYPYNAGYNSAEFSRTISASCGYCSATECRPMDPRIADILSCWMGAVIFPYNAGYNSAELAVINPLVADIILQRNAEQWARAPRRPYPARWVRIIFYIKFEFYIFIYIYRNWI